MIPNIPKVQKPQWDTETLQAIRHAQSDIDKAISSVRVLSEFFSAPKYTNGEGKEVAFAPQWEWRAQELQKQLAVLWALEDGLMGRSGINGYGNWLWPRGNARAYTTDEYLAMRQERQMVEKT